MRRVDRPQLPPHSCAFTLLGTDPDGFFTTNTVIRGLDPTAYVSATAVKTAAAQLGWLSPENHGELVASLDEYERRVEDLEAQLAEADKLITSIDVFESAGYTARKKAGRPKKEAVNG